MISPLLATTQYPGRDSPQQLRIWLSRVTGR